MPIHIKNLPLQMAGFAAATIPPGHYGFLLVKAQMTSDDPMFHTYVEQVSNIILSRAQILPNEVCAMVVVFHPDRTAHLFINRELGTIAKCRMKTPAKTGPAVGSMVFANHIADIVAVKPDVRIAKGDGVFYCAKVGWKFALWFDLTGDVNEQEMQLELGALHRRLGFDHLFRVVENGPQYEAMVSDGWFPFLELLPADHQDLAKVYADRVDFQNRIAAIVKRFTAERVDRIADRWWDTSVFADKREIIEAGLDAYKQGTPRGFTNAYKNLSTEVEGILRAQYSEDKGGPGARHMRIGDFIEHVIAKESAKEGRGTSLTLPTHFLTYLKDHLFGRFDEAAGNTPMSRNLAGHGVAAAGEYTQDRALQAILTLDQLWFFVRDENTPPPLANVGPHPPSTPPPAPPSPPTP